MALGPRKDVHWAVRENSPELLAALNEALLGHVRRNEDGRLVRSEFYNVVRARYFENTPRAGRHLADPFLLTRTGRISPYDRLFRKAGNDTGFDWRLLAALSFQESRFDPRAESWAGAYGLMQLKPRTAGVSADELHDPKLNVKLGAAHLRMLYERYSDVPEADRMRLVGADGYSRIVFLNQLLPGDGFIAYEWEGEPVPIIHGFPVRAVFPALNGNTWVKWLIEIEVF